MINLIESIDTALSTLNSTRNQLLCDEENIKFDDGFAAEYKTKLQDTLDVLQDITKICKDNDIETAEQLRLIVKKGINKKDGTLYPKREVYIMNYPECGRCKGTGEVKKYFEYKGNCNVWCPACKGKGY